jgi:hypothetical protein
MMKTARMTGNAEFKSPSFNWSIPAISIVLIAVIGAVGPDIWVGVPPNIAAKMLSTIAP